jgi:hypothetical protein
MLPTALIILTISGIAAVNGHFYVHGFGLGMGLLTLWYFTGHEVDLPPATDEELSSLTDSLRDSSAEFDLEDLPDFLRQIATRFSRGFGDREISRLITLACQLPHDRESQTEFQVAFNGSPAPLRVGFFKDDEAAVAVYFLSSSAVAGMLDDEIERFHSERGN